MMFNPQNSPITSWPRSEAALSRTKKSLAGGVSTGMRASMKPHPIFFQRGDGPKLLDLDGHWYTDYVLGWGPVILGHGHAGLTDAVSRQLPLGATYGAGHMLESQAAEAVLDRIPGVDRVIWSNTGSEANQTVLRLSRAYTGRHRYVKFRGHYHGWTDQFLVGYRQGPNGDLGLGTRGQDPAVLSNVELVDWGDLSGLRAVLEDPSKDIAAVYLEPVLVNSGVLEAPEGFLHQVRELCDRMGAVLIFDEVITGFRIAPGGAVERFGVTPDIVVLAKAIAGGYPLAAVAGKREIVDQVNDGVVHAGTYNGNPVVLAAAVATLEALGEEGVYDDFERRGSVLASGLSEAFANRDVPVSIHQVGPIVQVVPKVVNADSFASFMQADQAFYDRFIVEMLRRGQFILPGGRWYISTAHTDAQIIETVAAAQDSLNVLV